MQSGDSQSPSWVAPTAGRNSSPLESFRNQRPQVSRSVTASQILASFSPKSQNKKQNIHESLFPKAFPIVMEAHRRASRPKDRISYQISSDSENAESVSGLDSSFSTPQKTPRKRTSKINFEEDEPEVVESPKTPPPRLSSAGHSLRQAHQLNLSLRAQENGDKFRVKKKKLRRKSAPPPRSKTTSVAPKTSRNELRDQIATETAGTRANFFIAKKDLFLPLLPVGNHVQRLVDQQGDEDLSVPYEALQAQPAGVTASMKPYQLRGLSFLVYMYRNGVSGILGDEMGLGKTLQTLSLIQYLKEHRKQNESSELRPCLVVCPLSVLNSWIAEARKWTPGLKVLRFHGPMKERNRLKQIAKGEIDMHGNMTRAARQKQIVRRTTTGQPFHDLDSNSEDEITDERSVDLIVTTYEGFVAEQGWFKKAFVWKYVILDEGHKIKNNLSQISHALQGLGAEYRLILTGTPLQNNLQELWSLVHWLYPEVFVERTADLFKNSFNLTKGQVSTTVMDDVRRLLEVIMLRRMKNSEGVDLNLPPKTDILLYIPLTPMQRFWYMRLLTKADQGLLEELFQGAGQKEAMLRTQESNTVDFLDGKKIEDTKCLEKYAPDSANTDQWEETKEIMRQAVEQEQQDDSHKSAWKKLMNLLMQLRKVCNHPYLLHQPEKELGDHVIHASAKFIVLEKIINELVVKQKKKILVFSGFTRMLNCCEDFLALRGGNGELFNHLRLDGGTARARRNLGIRMFNDPKSTYRVMLISTRAGGLGINLATASDVVMLDQDWNPQIMLQAEARCHRIGQCNPVTVYKLCTQGTVEEQMMGRIQKKLYLSAKVTESMRELYSKSTSASSKGRGDQELEQENDVPQLNTSQLMSLVRRGAQTLAHPELDVDEMIGWNFETMLEKCRDKPADALVSESSQGNASINEEDEKRWLAQIEQVESRVFQGKKHKKAKENREIAQEWDRAERRVGKNTTVLVDGFAVSKESMKCEDWVAVPTLAGKDPRLAEVKREKKPAVVNQDHCQTCWDGGQLVLCSGCPRSYHYTCLDPDSKGRSKGKMNFSCPQHQCVDCAQKTSDAGGMLFRCRWCERGYCEDCLDWDRTELVGENLKEYVLLGFPAVNRAFYVKCPSCMAHHEENEEARAFCEQAATEIDTKYDGMMEEQALLAAAPVLEASIKPKEAPSRAESLTMTDATTISNSGINTPLFTELDKAAVTDGKRKAAPFSFKTTPTKRSKRLTA